MSRKGSFLEKKGPIEGGKRTFLKSDRSFGRPKGLFMGRMDRFGYGNDPLGDSLGPPDDKMDPFRDVKDRLGEKIDFFRKIRNIFVKKGSIMKENNHRLWGVGMWGRGVLQYTPGFVHRGVKTRG